MKFWDIQKHWLDFSDILKKILLREWKKIIKFRTDHIDSFFGTLRKHRRVAPYIKPYFGSVTGKVTFLLKTNNK